MRLNCPSFGFLRGSLRDVLLCLNGLVPYLFPTKSIYGKREALIYMKANFAWLED